jgi:hypothetical protein
VIAFSHELDVAANTQDILAAVVPAANAVVVAVANARGGWIIC